MWYFNDKWDDYVRHVVSERSWFLKILCLYSLELNNRAKYSEVRMFRWHHFWDLKNPVFLISLQYYCDSCFSSSLFLFYFPSKNNVIPCSCLFNKLPCSFSLSKCYLRLRLKVSLYFRKSESNIGPDRECSLMLTLSSNKDQRIIFAFEFVFPQCECTLMVIFPRPNQYWPPNANATEEILIPSKGLKFITFEDQRSRNVM